MAHLALALLGPFQVTLDGQPAAGLNSDRLRALLAYLAVGREREHPRQHLASLLWPERSDQEALTALRYALSNLRGALADRRSPAPFLLSTRTSVQFNLASDHWLDIAEFEELKSRSDILSLERALSLHRGPFLNGLSLGDSPTFEEWLLLQAEETRREVLSVLGRLTTLQMERGAYDAAASWARRQIEQEPYREQAHRQLMAALTLGGERSAALAHYETCCRLLAQDLGCEPDDETRALYTQIREGILPRPEPLLPIPVSPPLPISAGAQLFPRFVARKQELARLGMLLEQALAGPGGVALIAGEAGAGKTALLDAFTRQAGQSHSDLIILRGRCNAYGGMGDPYLSFREMLQTLAGDMEGKRAGATLWPEQARRVWEALPAVGAALVEHGPDLLDTFVPGEALLRRAEGFPSPGTGRSPGTARWQAGLREALTRAGETAPGTSPSVVTPQPDLFAQVTQVLHTVSLEHPLLLAIDDLQWADGGTVALLFHLGRRLAGSRILLACAYRRHTLDAPGGSPSIDIVLQELKREWGDILIDLDQVDGRAFVEAYLDSEPNRLATVFRQTLYHYTGGNPLFTVELLRGFERDGTLVRDEAGCWVEAAAPDWVRWPPQVEAVIAGHLAALPDEDQELLQAASVQGEQFIAEVAARVLGWREEVVIRRMSGPMARQHRLVSAAGLEWVAVEAAQLPGSVPPTPQPLSLYRFRHILVQDYVYHQIDQVARARLHEATGRAIEALFAPDPAALALQAGQLARHFAAAGQPFRAAAYHLHAAEGAMRLSAPETAIAHLRQGLALLSLAPDSPGRARLELELSLALNTPIVFTRGFGSAEQLQLHEQIYHLCQHPALANDPHRATAMTLVAYAAAWSADTGRAIEVGRQLFDLAQAAANVQQVVLAHWVLGTAYLFANEIELAREHLDRAVAGHDPALPGPPGWQYQVDPGVFSSILRAMLLWMQGYPDQARRDLETASLLTQRMAHLPSQALAHFLAATILYHLGRDVAAIARLVQIPPRPGETTAVLDGLRDLLAARQRAEATVAARPVGDQDRQADNILLQARAGLDTFHAVGPQVGRVPLLLILANGYALTGRPEPALVAMEQALRLIERMDMRLHEPEAHRLLAEILLLHGEPASAAEECFERAIDIARRLGLRWWELRATVSLARLWTGQGRAQAARTRLAEVYDWFTEGFDAPDMVEARALLDRL